LDKETAVSKIEKLWPGALSNKSLVHKISEALRPRGMNDRNTLVCTSLCCDEVNRPLEKALAAEYTNDFHIGGLAGVPFGGVTGFGAMAAHIPDGGSCLVVYGPHLGVDRDGKVGTVNRRGKDNGGSCCGSAQAAAGYVTGVAKGTVKPSKTQDPLDVEQSTVSNMLMPYSERLMAAKDLQIELPFALYDAQSVVMDKIIQKACGGVKGKNGRIALLGGIQINTPLEESDFFLPLRFEVINNEGKVLENLMASMEDDDLKALKSDIASIKADLAAIKSLHFM